jgi:5-formyltetrahydrofolate cyclo-ligase
MNLRQQKQQLRRDLRARRRALAPWRQQRNARRLAQVVARSGRFQRARHIALYLAGDGEIDPAPLGRRALRLRKRIYLPVLCPGGRLAFVGWRPGRALWRNRFGIGEPRGRRLPWRRLDLVLLPLVAFDARGGRLGMGGGFYDRTFAALRARPWPWPWRRPALVGLAHAFQEVAALPRETWDVPLAAVATERRWREASRPSPAQ